MHLETNVDEQKLAERITSTLYQLAQRGAIKTDVVQKAIKQFEIYPEKISPMRA